MKRIVGFLMLMAPVFLFAQITPASTGPKPQKRSIGFGIRAGFNFANVTNASAVNASNRAGFNAGIFLAPSTRGVLGSRTELSYSRHGYNYASDTANGSVNLDYIALAQLMAIHITRYVEIDIGGQTAYLLSARIDSSKQMATGNAELNSALSYYNRFDYGFGGGVEVHPVAGLLIGARYNISLSNLYKQSFMPSASSINLKNNVVQVYAGYRF
ncbi:MAG TPA: porin family protein [Puia sp.]|nr:porin family protein [Puia sp.]